MIGTGASPSNAGTLSETLGVASNDFLFITASASVDTKGSWVDFGTTSFDYNLITLQMLSNSSRDEWCIDIGVNVSGNVFVIAEDLRFFQTERYSGDMPIETWTLPLFVKAGAVLSARSAVHGGVARTCRVALQGYNRGVAGMRGFSRCRAISTLTNNASPIVDPGGTINTKGSYTQLTASSGFNAAALIMGIGYAGDFSRAATAKALCDLAIGGAGSEQVILSNFPLGWSTGLSGPYFGLPVLLPFAVPSGTRFAARGQCSVNTAGDRQWEVGLWGFEQ